MSYGIPFDFDMPPFVNTRASQRVVVSRHAGGPGVFGGEGARRSSLSAASVPGTASRSSAPALRARAATAALEAPASGGAPRVLRRGQPRRPPWPGVPLRGAASLPLCGARAAHVCRVRGCSAPRVGGSGPAAEARAVPVPCKGSALAWACAADCCQGADRLLGRERRRECRQGKSCAVVPTFWEVDLARSHRTVKGVEGRGGKGSWG